MLRFRNIRRRRDGDLSWYAGEVLEVRSLLSSAGIPAAVSDLHVSPVRNAASGTQPYTPTQIRQAYGFDQITFGTVAANGSGQTIAIVDAYGDPNMAADLATFDQKYGLPAPAKFTQVNQQGGAASPQTDAGWAMEQALDVEWAHAMAPGASILLVEANSSSLTDLLAAVNYAKSYAGVSVVSMSWGSDEFSGETSYDSSFITPAGHQGVTFVASAGDTAALPEWPAVSPNVLSVGGTTLNLAQNAGTGRWSRTSETAWSDSGGGVSTFESEPSWQRSVQSRNVRSTPDVGYDADPNTGFSVYDSVAYQGISGWWDVGGTSAGAPQWAAIIAIANQGRALNGLGSMSQTNAAIYSLPSTAFFDVTSGNAGNNAAGVGYDLVTGLGAPVVNVVLQQLVGSSSTPPTSVGAPGNVTVVAASTTAAQITWTTASGAQGYRVFQVNSSGGTTLLATLGSSVTTYTATGLAAGTQVSFKVEAYNATSTADSPVVSVTLPTPPPPPQSLTPPKVTATAISSTTVVLSWNQVAGAQGYRIYSFNGNRFVLLGTVSSSTTSVKIINLRPNSTARFIVEAFSNSQVADSAIVSVTMPAVHTRARHHSFAYGTW